MSRIASLHIDHLLSNSKVRKHRRASVQNVRSTDVICLGVYLGVYSEADSVPERRKGQERRSAPKALNRPQRPRAGTGRAERNRTDGTDRSSAKGGRERGTRRNRSKRKRTLEADFAIAVGVHLFDHLVDLLVGGAQVHRAHHVHDLCPRDVACAYTNTPLHCIALHVRIYSAYDSIVLIVGFGSFWDSDSMFCLPSGVKGLMGSAGQSLSLSRDARQEHRISAFPAAC